MYDGPSAASAADIRLSRGLPHWNGAASTRTGSVAIRANLNGSGSGPSFGTNRTLWLASTTPALASRSELRRAPAMTSEKPFQKDRSGRTARRPAHCPAGP